MVGLHGVAGLGKTTLCKVMVNYYSSHYCGRSFLVECPSTGDDSPKITLECKKALHKLTDASYEHLLDNADDFDQVVQLMRDRIGHYDVFLAIDNVGKSCLENAERVLQVGFSANSKILVTSRSEEALKDLLMVGGPVNNVSVAPLPAPKREEAFQIFQDTFKLHDLCALVDSNQMDNVLGKCRFNGSYHALAVKALAKHVKEVCMTADTEGIKHHLSCILKEVSYENLTDVEAVIHLSYDNLSNPKKHMFLDVVVCLREWNWYHNTYAEAQEWIGFLYSKLTKSESTRLINELSFDGLIQIEADKYGTKKVGVHDLYRELALKEIATSPRFLIEHITEVSMENIEWEKLEIVILNSNKWDPSLFEKLEQCQCPELKLLRALDIEIKSKIRLNLMPSLSVLTLEHITLVEDEHGSAATDSERTGFVGPEGPVNASCILHLNGLVGLRKLEVKCCSFVEKVLGLHALGNLQMLTFYSCERLYSLDGLSGLVMLQVLQILDCSSLQELPDVSGLTYLERLELVDNAAMEEIGGLSCTLKSVIVEGCWALKRMANVSHMTCLERLELCRNEAMEEVGGLRCTLKDVRVEGCQVLKRMPDVSILTGLENLKLCWNEAMEEVGGEYLSSTLKHFDITECMILGSCPSLDECMHLETLRTGSAKHVRSLRDLPNLHTSLQHLSINECGRSTIKKIDVGCLTNLKDLDVFECGALEEILDLSALCSLKSLRIWRCPKLEKLNVGCPSLRKLEEERYKVLEEIEVSEEIKALTNLEDLNIEDCEMLKELNLGCASLKKLNVFSCKALEEIIWDLKALPSLKALQIERCRSLKILNVGCASLKTLTVWRCKALEEIAWELKALHSVRSLDITRCSSLKILNVGCPRLKKLEVGCCKALEEIRGDLSALASLEELRIRDCQSLKRLEGISSTPLERLFLRGCKSLQESSIPGAILPKNWQGYLSTDLEC